MIVTTACNLAAAGGVGQNSRAARRQFGECGPAMARGQARDFFESLGLLLEAGVPMFQALPIAVSTLSNRNMQ